MSAVCVCGYHVGHLDQMCVKAALLAHTSATTNTISNRQHNILHSNTNHVDSNRLTQCTDRDSVSASVTATASLDDDEDHIFADRKVADADAVHKAVIA